MRKSKENDRGPENHVPRTEFFQVFWVEDHGERGLRGRRRTGARENPTIEQMRFGIPPPIWIWRARGGKAGGDRLAGSWNLERGTANWPFFMLSR